MPFMGMAKGIHSRVMRRKATVGQLAVRKTYFAFYQYTCPEDDFSVYFLDCARDSIPDIKEGSHLFLICIFRRLGSSDSLCLFSTPFIS